MTSRFSKTWVLAVLGWVLAAGISDVAARQIQPTASQQRFRQSVQQSQVRDQLQKSQVEHNIKQQSLELARKPASSTTPNDTQIDKAKQAQDALYQAQQRDRLQRYSDALTPQPVPHAAKGEDAKKKDGG